PRTSRPARRAVSACPMSKVSNRGSPAAFEHGVALELAIAKDSFETPGLGGDVNPVGRAPEEFVVVVTDEVRHRPAMFGDRLGPFLGAEFHHFGELGFGRLELPGSFHLERDYHQLTSLSRSSEKS